MDGESNAPMVPGAIQFFTSESTKSPQYLVTFAANLVAFTGGTVIGWKSNLLIGLLFNNRDLFESLNIFLLFLMMTIGAIIGAMSAGAIADILGRKVTLMINIAPLTVLWVIVLFAWEAWFLYVALFFGGVAVGVICTAVPMYVSEIAEVKIKGTLGCVFPIMIAGGIEYSYIIGYFFHYTIIPLFFMPLNIVFVLALVKVPESPLFLLKKHRKKEMEDSLKYLRGERYNIYEEINILEKEIGQKNTVYFRESVTEKSNFKAMAICTGLMFFKEMCAIDTMMLEFANLRVVGIDLDLNDSLILFGLIPILSGIVTASLVDYLGRKTILLFSIKYMAISLFVLGFYWDLVDGRGKYVGVVPLISLMIYFLTYTAGFCTIPWMIPAEILHPDIKNTGMGIVFALYWLFSQVPIASIIKLNFLHPKAIVLVKSIVCCLSYILVRNYFVETKGKDVFEIREELKK